jgi:protein-S-isoprenylcysteine O-methyltransferase Ste14
MSTELQSPLLAEQPAEAPPRPRLFGLDRDLLLDIGERAFVLLLFAIFAQRMLPRLVQLVAAQLTYPELFLAAAGINAQALLLVVSEGLGVALILLRRRSPSLSAHPFDWGLCLLAVILPLFVARVPAGALIPAALATALMLIGLLVQIAAKVTLWRSFGIVPANRGVRSGGLYRWLRHPMYAGYMLTHVGFLLGFPSLFNAALYGAAFAVQIARILREETILARDPAYRDYAARVRYRLLPGVF